LKCQRSIIVDKTNRPHPSRPPEGDGANPLTTGGRPLLLALPPSPPPAEVAARSPGGADGGGSPLPASRRSGRGHLPLWRRCFSGSSGPACWVALAAVPSHEGEARLPKLCRRWSLVWAHWLRWAWAGLDGLERAGLDGGRASWWWRGRLGGVLRQRLGGQHIAAGWPELYGPIWARSSLMGCGDPAYHCMCSMQVVDITPMKHRLTSITSSEWYNRNIAGPR
jgi:hypothetical protein